MGIFNYTGLPAWIMMFDLTCWGALAVFGFHFFTCGV